MYCEYCGKQISATAEFCPHCGMPVAVEVEPAAEQSIAADIHPIASEMPEIKADTQPIASEMPEIKADTQAQPQTPPQVHGTAQTQTHSQPEAYRPAQTQTHSQPEAYRPAQPQTQQESYGPGQSQSYTQTRTSPSIQMPKVDINDIAGKVGDFTGKVSDFTGKVRDAAGAAGKFIPGPVGDALDITLADGETLVKRYSCADLKGVMGYMIVTNKRLMFSASGGKSRYNQEVTLSSVSGLTCHRGTNLIWNRIVPGIVLALIGLMALFSMGGYGYGGGGIGMAGFMLIIFGAILIFLGMRPAYQVAIYAKDVSLSPIVIGEGPRSLMGNSALYAFACKPTPETEIMISELGALIQDLQGMGDLAIRKWQNS